MEKARLDKIIAGEGTYSRREVRLLVRQGRVLVDGVPARSPEDKVVPEAVEIMVDWTVLHCRRYTWIMLHKPAGVLSATEDGRGATVLDLLPPELRRRGLFPVGRLDKDTTGLLLLTNDGALAHDLLSPKKHVDKTYLVKPEKPLSTEDIHRLENGLDIGDEKPTAPSKARLTENGDLLLTIHEGRFHQVKRMLQAVDNQVLTLERVSFGPLSLDLSLQRGEYRALTEEEIKVLSGSGKKS